MCPLQFGFGISSINFVTRGFPPGGKWNINKIHWNLQTDKPGFSVSLLVVHWLPELYPPLSMAAGKAVVYVSTTSAFASTFSHSLSPSYSNSTPLKRRKRMLMCAMPRPQNWRESRRLVAISLVLLHSASSIPPRMP